MLYRKFIIAAAACSVATILEGCKQSSGNLEKDAKKVEEKFDEPNILALHEMRRQKRTTDLQKLCSAKFM